MKVKVTSSEPRLRILAPLLKWLGIACVVLIGMVLVPIPMIAVAHASLSDAGFTELVQGQLNRHLPGRFMLGNVHWELPLLFTISDVRVDSPDGKPAIRVDLVDVQMHPLDLLHAKIQVSPVRIRGAHVWVTQTTPTSHVNLDVTFRQDPNDLESGGLPGPLQVHLDDISVAASALLVDVPGANLAFQNIQLEKSSVAIANSTLSVTARVVTQAELQLGKTRLSLGRVAVQTEQATLHFGQGRRDVQGKSVNLQLDGISLQASGSMQAMAHKVEKFDTHADANLDIYKMKVLPLEVKNLLHGQASMHIAFAGDDVRQHFNVHLAGTSLAIHDVALQSASVAGTLHRQDILLRDVQVSSNAGNMSAHGELAISAAGIGAHAVHLGVTNVALRRLAGPYVSVEGLLPRVLHAELDAKGADLWPPTSLVDLHAVGSGIEAAEFPGVPDPMELTGKFELDSKGIHILALQLLGLGTDFVLRGDVPWHPDSIVEVLGELCHVPVSRTLKDARLVYEPVPAQLKQRWKSIISSWGEARDDVSQRIRAALTSTPAP